MANNVDRVIAYIDGYNLYYGIRDLGVPRYKWLNMQRLAVELIDNQLGQRASLVKTKYFTAAIAFHPGDPGKTQRQNELFSALRTLPDFAIFYGTYLPQTLRCPRCGFNYSVSREKKSDVNLAVEMVRDAFTDAFDIALLISGDSDLVPPVRVVKEAFPEKRVFVAFPPNRVPNELRALADYRQKIRETLLSRSLLPEQINLPSGVVLTCPAEWR